MGLSSQGVYVLFQWRQLMPNVLLLWRLELGPIITDGGFVKGGDLCKAFAAGADAVMLGYIFAQAKEASGFGHYWGMSHPH